MCGWEWGLVCYHSLNLHFCYLFNQVWISNFFLSSLPKGCSFRFSHKLIDIQEFMWLFVLSLTSIVLLLGPSPIFSQCLIRGCMWALSSNEDSTLSIDSYAVCEVVLSILYVPHQILLDACCLALHSAFPIWSQDGSSWMSLFLVLFVRLLIVLHFHLYL